MARTSRTSRPPPDLDQDTEPREPPARWVDYRQLKRWPDNPRDNEGNVPHVANSIKAFGFGAPMVARLADWEIIKGHTRHKAVALLVEEWRVVGEEERSKWKPDAQRIARTGMVPVRFLDLSAEEAHQLCKADNKLNELSRWDESKLYPQLEIQTPGVRNLMGWSEVEVVEMGRRVRAPDRNDGGSEGEDNVPEPPKAPIVREGDVWHLGRHVLVCGASGTGLVGPLLPSGTRSAVTDPPYCSGGFQEGNKAAGSVGRATEHKKIANDRLSTRGYVALMRSVLEQLQPLDVHIFTDWKMWSSLFDVTESTGLTVRSMIVWGKPSAGLGVGWRAQHELIQYGHRGKPTFEHEHGNLLLEKRQKNELHTTQKPVEVVEQLVRMAEGETVVDSFAGSGTTLIACEKQGRACFLVELDPAYCDVIIERWQQFTGGKAQKRGGSAPRRTRAAR